ncbi:DNA-processing protein DprA [uncultured Aquitalea sp.]|uniref:DNA-processing protein DprA n=1 Tax=uncultured Aquitalea sp. TaxID=540272 RepID=UPI0025FD50C6|nr:DNA-processing protein DprA [uncultured Aquitalea sp.]
MTDKAWLQLALTPGIGPAGFLRLLQAFGQPEAAIAAPAAHTTPFIGPAAAQALREGASAADADAALIWAEQAGCSLMTLADPDYPQALAESPSPPPLLFLRGRRAMLQQPLLAMVGSRSATPVGEKTARRFAGQLAEHGYTIVSGLAGGIDAAAHRGALEYPSSTIAVIGTGIDRVYPSANRQLARDISDQGLIVSEFALGLGPLASHFPRRNRIIAALSRGCLVVEAGLKSGSLITARLAAEQGREVMAVPGSIHNAQARGCHQLIRDGAALVQSAEDVLDEVGRLQRQAKPKTVIQPSDSEHPLLAAMGHDAIHAEQLSQQLGLTQGEVYAMLLELELAGRLATLSDGRVQRLD